MRLVLDGFRHGPSSLSRWLNTRRAAAVTALLAAAMLLRSSPYVVAAGATAAEGEPLTALVLVDDASRDTLGAFPLPRSVYARAIDKAMQLGAKGVALKFFFASASESAADDLLVKAMRAAPVLIETFPGEETSVPASMAREDWSLEAIHDPMKLNGIALPHARFLGAARAVGFVEARLEGAGSAVETAALVQGRIVESLQVEILELATGDRARLAGRELRLGRNTFALDEKGRIPCDVAATPEPAAIGIAELLEGRVPADRIRGRVVVLGYGRSDSPRINLAGREVPIHVAFYRQVQCVAKRIAG